MCSRSCCCHSISCRLWRCDHSSTLSFSLKLRCPGESPPLPSCSESLTVFIFSTSVNEIFFNSWNFIFRGINFLQIKKTAFCDAWLTLADSVGVTALFQCTTHSPLHQVFFLIHLQHTIYWEVVLVCFLGTWKLWDGLLLRHPHYVRLKHVKLSFSDLPGTLKFSVLVVNYQEP